MALKEGQQIIAQKKAQNLNGYFTSEGNIYCLYGHVYTHHPPVQKIGI